MDNQIRKGIVCAGGFGTRLRPMTQYTNKHLLPIYDKPMVFYPIELLIKSGITDIAVVTGGENLAGFLTAIGDGSQWKSLAGSGVQISFLVQKTAGGIADAIRLCSNFAQGEPVVVALGDNIFGDERVIQQTIINRDINDREAVIFTKEVEDPRRFGVCVYDPNGRITDIIEKPEHPPSNDAVTGMYIYPSSLWSDVIDSLKPSARGELEVSDINQWYAEKSLLINQPLKGFWRDCGTPEGLLEAANHVKSMLST